MKVAVALIGIALTAALVVSATMGAGTLVPGDGSTASPPPPPAPGSTTKLPRGEVTPNGKARLMPVSFAPPTLKGSGFRPGENVTVDVDGKKKKVKASSSGTFTVRYASRVDRCHGMTAIAVGDKGSRTGFQLSEFMCAASGAQ